MDRKDKELIREIIAGNAIIAAISIFLWVRYYNHIGFLVTIISLWVSFVSIRIIMNRHGVCMYDYSSNSFKDRFVRKLLRW